MKPSAANGTLKASDIVRADRIPGFETNLLRTTVRVTQSGWASCIVGTWWPDRGTVEVSVEHRFTLSELASLRDALGCLSTAVPEAITCDDMPTQRLAFAIGADNASLERIEPNRFETDFPLFSGDFTTAWDLIHEPFRAFIAQQAEPASPSDGDKPSN